jgi:hypothetical protein
VFRGNFYYNDPIREFSDPPANSSNIIIKKYQYHQGRDDTKYEGFNTWMGMMCGDHVFKKGDLNLVPSTDSDPLANLSADRGLSVSDGDWFVSNCKTPILTHIRLISPPSNATRWSDGSSIDRGISFDPESTINTYSFEATDHVMNFSHSWSESNLTTMEHSGTIQFYLNRSMESDNNVTDKLMLLQDKTFYIEVFAGYDSNPIVSPEDPNRTTTSECNYMQIPGFYKMFTGLCQGGNISYEYGKNIMTCRLEDYSIVLKGMRFFNSPWFDGMKDVVALNEIMQMAGFRNSGAFDPGRLVYDIAEDAISSNPQKEHSHFDGRVFQFETFALPSGYNRLLQPAFKFNDGDPFIDAIAKLSSFSAKIFYFDEHGIAHYEDYRDTVEKDFFGAVPLEPLYLFTVNEANLGGHLVFNKVERSFDVAGVANHIKIVTNTPDMHFLIKDHYKWDSINNPEATGFLGYKKTAYQVESMFGSKEAQIQAINKYSVMFKPKVKVKFETYGLPLRATDIVSLEGEALRVTKVDHSLDASKNLWWMNVECERHQPIDASDFVGGEG